jgi:hypothetical protein
MAVKTFWLTGTGDSTYGDVFLQEDGTAPTTATTGSGWTVAKLAPPQFSYLIYNTERDTTSFLTALPAHPYTTSSSSAYSNKLTGTFAAGTWTFYLRWIAVTNGGALDPRFHIAVWKATEFYNAYVELTTAYLVTNTISNLSTAASQEATVTWNAPAIVMAGHRIMFSIWLDIQGAGANNGADCLLRIGTEGNGCKVVTTDFSAGMAGAGAVGTVNVSAPNATIEMVDAQLYMRTVTGAGL